MNLIGTLAIFAITYFFLFREKVDRTIVTLTGAVVMVLIGTFRHFYPQPQAFEAINFDTIILVLGMMILVGTVERTGLVEYLAIRIAQKSEGRVWC